MKLPNRVVVFALHKNNRFCKNISKHQTVFKNKAGIFTTAMPLIGNQMVVNKDTSTPGHVIYWGEIHINVGIEF
jgi:hypothetical protein